MDDVLNTSDVGKNLPCCHAIRFFFTEWVRRMIRWLGQCLLLWTVFFWGNWEKKTPCLVEATSPSLNPGIREMYSISTLTALDWMTIAQQGLTVLTVFGSLAFRFWKTQLLLGASSDLEKSPTQAMNIQIFFWGKMVYIICFALFEPSQRWNSKQSLSEDSELSLREITNTP